MKKDRRRPRHTPIHPTCYACGDIGPGVKLSPFAGELLCEDCALALMGEKPKEELDVRDSR